MSSSMLESSTELQFRNIAPYTAILVVTFIFIQRQISLRKYQYLRTLPTPGGASWIWGHEKQIFDQSVGTAYTNWINQLQSHVFRIKASLFKPDILVVADPSALTHIMQRNIYDYPHSEVLRPRIARLLGKSLGWVEGESEHRRMRHLVATSLTQEAIKQGSSDIFGAADTLCNSLEAHVIASENGVSTTVNIQEWTSAATLQVIGRFGFGHDFEGGRSSDASRILGAWRSMVQMGISYRGFIALMFLRRFSFLNYLPLKALRAQGEVRLSIHRGIAEELIRREKNHVPEGNDLLSKLINAYQSQKISLEELKDHISMLIMSGSETTSQTLSYAIWELAKNPESQDKLRKEITALPSTLSYDDLQDRAPYLSAVCKEALRFHPAGPYMERVATKDDTLPLCFPVKAGNSLEVSQVHVSSGQTIIIPIYSINRDNSIWGDGDVFRPERWMEDMPPKEISPSGWSRILTFSDGPRQCLGWRLAVLEIKIMLSSLIRKFEFIDTGAVISHKVASSLQPMCEGGEESNPKLPITVKIL